MTAKKADYHPHPASFRDPAGFVFQSDRTWYRQVNEHYREDYLLLMESGLYAKATAKGLLLPHQEVEENKTGRSDWYKTLLPEQLSFISYPEEWSPAQLKEAALCTLTLLRLSVENGMVLKDATPRNIAFSGGKAVFIDTLSFQRHDPSHPWVAYRQFCEYFLYPLYLHHYHRSGTHRTFLAWPEGIPARETLGLLPGRSRLRLGVWLHVFLPAKIRGDRKPQRPTPVFDKNKLLQLATNLEEIIRGMDINAPAGAGWSGYYEGTILSPAYLQEKEKIFREWIQAIDFGSALDLGANDGYFSRILAEKKGRVLATDADWICMQALHRWIGDRPGSDIHVLCMDIVHPTPAAGFQNAERTSFTKRAISDLVVALALVHHLVLGRNIPLALLAGYFAELTGTWLMIEFVPLTDEKSKEILRNKSDYPGQYDAVHFEERFLQYFRIERQASVPGTDRVLYLMRKKELIR